MAVLLYYPLVKPPTEVLHQALLYWDGIGSVVPVDPRVYEAAVSPELKDLRDLGLYKPLGLTGEYMDILRDPDDIRPWLAAEEQRCAASLALRHELRRLAVGPDRPRVSSPPESFLYESKMSSWLPGELQRLRLATSRDERHWTVGVPHRVQEVVVGAMARELARNANESYTPYTDRPDAHRLSLSAGMLSVPAWEVELGRLLPVPAPGTETAKVLTFRRNHKDERDRLMRALHGLLGALRRDYEHPADILAQLRREIEQSVESYRKAAKSSRMAWVERSVMATVGLAAAAGGVVQPGLSWALGAVGSIALNVATREIRPLARAREDHDFSYLHQVRETFT
ncbi:DUF6236 family protein [Streptomyces sp. NPDC001401]|uniref:DUF6236 family protein n=1 Tax=Streptomyces sp. NPDC001401 TaxID=3364570 RepID=UPI0036B40B13